MLVLPEDLHIKFLLVIISEIKIKGLIDPLKKFNLFGAKLIQSNIK